MQMLTVTITASFLSLGAIWQQDERSTSSRNPSTCTTATLELPKSLTALERHRENAMRKGVVEWHLQSYEETSNTRNYTSRFSKANRLLTDRGDGDGIITLDPVGRPMPGPFHYLRRAKGEQWHSNGRSVSAVLIPPEPAQGEFPIFDVRTAGLCHWPDWSSDVHALLSSPSGKHRTKVTYAEEVQDGLHVVTASYSTPTGARVQQRWRLDPQRGWSPVRCEYLENGELLAESRTSLRNFNGVWFPESVAFFAKRYKDGKSPTQVLAVDSAQFGESLPDEITLDEIGIEVGTNLRVQATKTEPAKALIWDGTRGVAIDEFFARVKKGELKQGANVLRFLAEDPVAMPATDGSGIPPAAQNTLDEWERYVKRFVEEHSLPEPQQKSAKGILTNCKDKARNYCLSKKRDFDRLAELSRPTPPVVDGAVNITKWNSDRLDLERKLMRPINQIFEQDLKPRLEAILSSEQRP